MHTQNMEGRIIEAKEKLNTLEIKGENTILLKGDMVSKKDISIKLHDLSGSIAIFSGKRLNQDG